MIRAVVVSSTMARARAAPIPALDAPVVSAGACALGSVLVVLGWRRYRRTLAELDAARREIRREVESIRELLHSHRLDN